MDGAKKKIKIKRIENRSDVSSPCSRDISPVRDDGKKKRKKKEKTRKRVKNRFPATLTEGFSFSLRRRARSRTISFRHALFSRSDPRERARETRARTDGRTDDTS